MLLVLVFALAALQSMRPKLATGGGAATAPLCSPRPCTELDGFKVYVTDVQRSADRLTLKVSFRNDTGVGVFETVSYRHTGPLDFSLQDPGTGKLRPTTGPGCPAWEEARINRGSSAGPDRLCFDVVGAEVAPLLWWSPDQGLLAASGSVPLP